MIKNLLIITALTLTFSQEVSRLNSFKALENINLEHTVLAWEIDNQRPDLSGNHYSNYSYYSDQDDSEKLFDLYELTSKTGTTVFALGIGKNQTDMNMIMSSNAEDLEIKVASKVVWLGKQDVRDSYNFIKKLGAKTEKKHRIYYLLNDHGFNEETFNFFKAEYAMATSDKIRKNLIFYIADIPEGIGVPFLDELYAKESSRLLKNQIVFGYHHAQSDKSLQRLFFIAKHETNVKLGKKAIFWLGQRASNKMENYFDQIIFSNDEYEIKKAAIFALYNMKNEAKLKHVVETSKDIRLRKKALFWLGQLEVDVAYLESIINKKN